MILSGAVPRGLAAFALGALLVLAFAPFGQGWLAVPVLAGIGLLWASASGAREAAWLGWAFGLGLMGFGVSWLRHSIDLFGGVVPPLSLLLTVLFVSLMAGWHALAGALARVLGGAGGVRFWLGGLPLAWLAVELLRSRLFTGFPWLSVGYSQIDGPLAGIAPLLGVFGTGLAVVLSAGLAALALGGPGRRGAVLALVLLWGCAWGLARVDWSRPAGAAVPVALVQGNVAQRIKWRPEQFPRSMAVYRALSARAPEAHLLVWPETAIAAFDDAVEETVLRPLETTLRAQGRDLLTGIVDREPDGRYHNAMLLLGVSGRQVYHKRHLVPFGEYLPLPGLLRPVLDFLHVPMSDFSPGRTPPVLRMAGWPVGVDICYEDAFGHEIAAALPEAAWLINASNDAWFGDSLAPHQHLEIARMRALETGRWLLRATNTGISAVIDHRGRVRARAPQFAEAVLRAEVRPRAGATPYVRWRDAPLWVLALAGLSALGWRRFVR